MNIEIEDGNNENKKKENELAGEFSVESQLTVEPAFLPDSLKDVESLESIESAGDFLTENIPPAEAEINGGLQAVLADMQRIDGAGTVANYEEAVRRIVLLEERLKIKDNELIESQKLIESVLAENRDKIEALERSEEKLKLSEIVIEKLSKDIYHEHDRRRRHLLNVRDLKHAIAERDARIKQLEEGGAGASPLPQKHSFQPGMYAVSYAPAAEDEIKKLQSDIFYKEIELEKLNSLLAAAQNEVLAFKTANDELNDELEALKLEISYKENQCSEYHAVISSLESKIDDLSDQCSLTAGLNLSREDIEKLKVDAEIKTFLEIELERMSKDEGEGFEVRMESNQEDQLSNDEIDSDGAVDKRQITEIDEIKEKFKSLMAERDKAIKLVDKFEVESKKNERELNDLRVKYSEVCGEKESALSGLKEKESELQGIYNAFSSYKEESGFMSRENKMLKEERESLTAELEKLKASVKELEKIAADKQEEISKLTLDFEEKLKAAEADYESRMNSALLEKEEELQGLKISSDANSAAYIEAAEKKAAELEEFKNEFEILKDKYQTALADYQGMRINVESLLSGVSETLKSGGFIEEHEELRPAGGTVENKLIIIEAGTGNPDKNTVLIFEKFCLNCELEIDEIEYGNAEEECLKRRPVLYVIAVNGEEDIAKVTGLAGCLNVPAVLYSRGAFSTYKITELISRGIIEDYIGFDVDEKIVDSVMNRVIDGRLSRINKVIVKKDIDEIKLRESVALTIDNRVKAGRIEELNERIVYLQDANRRMRSSIVRMQELFDRIIAGITALSLQDIPPNINEGFNEITDLLLKISAIKL